MEEMIARWIRETKLEYSRAYKNQNFYRMHEMRKLEKALNDLRGRLAISGT